MEAPLLTTSKRTEEEEEEEEEERKKRWEKLKKVASMAAPMVAVNISQYLLQGTSTMIVGHRSELSLAGISLGASFANVTGFGLLCGLAAALETLCGQAYGAKQYHKLGSYTCTSIFVLLLVCLPVSLLWIFVKQLLILFHQDPEISEIASTFCIWLIPSLFGYSILQSLVRYFQSQGLILPMVLSSFTALCFHLPLCWFLVYTLGFGVKGAAISISVSHWFNAVFLWFFMKRSRKCEGARVHISDEGFAHVKIFFQFAVPSAVMICVEWLAFEVITLLSGLLPNAKLETSVISVCLTTSSLHYNVVNGIGAAASTNVANELGAGNPSGARASAFAAVMIGAAESAVISVGLFFSRHVWGYAFSNVEEVIRYASEITPVLCISVVMDSFLAVLSGVVRGTGWQKMGAYLNIASYYLVGIPSGLLLCFVLHVQGKGLWIGLLSGSTLQSLILFLIIGFTNWTKEAIKARERIFEKTVIRAP
ncbi:PREDICTED: protein DETOXIFICATION 9-like [Tarenaya hassleriana]|uniref:protein DETOXIFICATION 9-like n=1 Tax=Tarenaya hassleriana TaxID=28532 RepID=UPI00053C3B42|nr:PREDICTED: protein DETOXIFICATION 9-like [Tarenaya hassleriana]XP_010528508.1 PREDICTED: protein DETOXIFICATION 9-like [Tarenaya hassleriana]